MIETPLLQSDLVRLTALTHNDLPTMARWYQNPTFLRLLDARAAHPQGEASLADWLDKSRKSQSAFLFGIRLQKDNTLIGYVELEGILWTHQVGWLAIGIGETSVRGKGYGRLAMQLTLGFAFRELNLHRVQLTVFSYNQRAIALYEKLGFQREGTYREFLHRDGQRHDMFLYGLLRREWEGRLKDEGKGWKEARGKDSGHRPNH